MAEAPWTNIDTEKKMKKKNLLRQSTWFFVEIKSEENLLKDTV